MRKIVANIVSILLMLAAIMGMSSEAFYPKAITFVLAAPMALLSAIWLRNALVPYEAKPSSKSFGARDNRGLRTVTLLMIMAFTYLALIYFAASFLAVATGQAQYRLGTVNNWDSSSQTPFTRRRSGRCTRLSASIKTGDGDLHMSKCIGDNFPIILGAGSGIFIETVESPFGTLVTGNLRFSP